MLLSKPFPDMGTAEEKKMAGHKGYRAQVTDKQHKAF